MGPFGCPAPETWLLGRGGNLLFVVWLEEELVGPVSAPFLEGSSEQQLKNKADRNSRVKQGFPANQSRVSRAKRWAVASKKLGLAKQMPYPPVFWGAIEESRRWEAQVSEQVEWNTHLVAGSSQMTTLRSFAIPRPGITLV